jgi:hypothetical protein
MLNPWVLARMEALKALYADLANWPAKLMLPKALLM